MSKINKHKVIISLAKKMPDTPIDQIIAQELISNNSIRNTISIKKAISFISIILVLFSCKAGLGFLSDNYSGLLYNASNVFLSKIDSIVSNNDSGASSIQRNEDNTYERYNNGYKLVSCGLQDMSSASITIPQQYEGLDIVAIGSFAFSGFDNLEIIEIPDTVKEIEERAFENCSSLNNVVIPDSVNTIRSGAFMNCTSLKDIIFGSGITSIEGECFKGCTSIVEFIVPPTVTEIRGNCFEGCTSLKAVSLHNQITTIHGYAFINCTSLEEIALPENITEIRGNTFENCKSLKEISIPKGVTRIAAHSFRGCSSLYKVEVPDSVLEIGSSAFRNCYSLMSIELPNSVMVDERAFKESPTKITYK